MEFWHSGRRFRNAADRRRNHRFAHLSEFEHSSDQQNRQWFRLRLQRRLHRLNNASRDTGSNRLNQLAKPDNRRRTKTRKNNNPRRKPSTPVKRPLVREPKPGEQFAAIPERVRSADAQTMTAMHFEKSETLLRAFRNVRLNEPGTAAEVGYERKRAQQLVYQNMMLRREADASR